MRGPAPDTGSVANAGAGAASKAAGANTAAAAAAVSVRRIFIQQTFRIPSAVWAAPVDVRQVQVVHDSWRA
ncbi:RNA helicase [Streptomyces lydicamycinicus]|uniref:RNA helicase n=1 Tax=Streptomyces lydicamycinicus TaxID=1546107 RepID=A0A0P4RC61_9ACTN|nr:RNA helicase [Streptomyces lydicamycinicus]